MRWEYDDMHVFSDGLKEDRKSSFKYMGDNGWELVSVDNGTAYFKRPIPEPAVLNDEATAGDFPKTL